MSTSTATPMDTFIKAGLLSLQTSFFQSLQSGSDTALAAFYQEMAGFNETLSSCVQDLGEETCLSVYSFAQMSNAVIPGLIDLDVSSEKINREQGEEFNKLLGKLSLDDTTFPGPILIIITMPRF